MHGWFLGWTRPSIIRSMAMMPSEWFSIVLFPCPILPTKRYEIGSLPICSMGSATNHCDLAGLEFQQIPFHQQILVHGGIWCTNSSHKSQQPESQLFVKSRSLGEGGCWDQRREVNRWNFAPSTSTCTQVHVPVECSSTVQASEDQYLLVEVPCS